MMIKRKKAMFVTWDGPQNDYLEALFLPAFSELGENGWEFHILQFSWGVVPSWLTDVQKLFGPNVRVHRAKVWKGFPLAELAFLLARAPWIILRQAQSSRADVVVARSIAPAIAILALGKKLKPPIVYDADGLWVDERIEAGDMNAGGLRHRALQFCELKILRAARVVLSRTAEGSKVLEHRAGSVKNLPFLVTPYARKPPLVESPPDNRRGKHQDSRSPTVCYLGSVGAQYKPETMLTLALSLKRRLKDLKFRVFTGDQKATAEALLALGLEGEKWITVERLRPDQIHDELSSCDFALAFREFSFSTQAVFPVKIYDYLLAGLPIVGTVINSDLQKLVERGVFLSSDGLNHEEVGEWIATKLANSKVSSQQAHKAVSELFSFSSAVVLLGQALSLSLTTHVDNAFLPRRANTETS
jgi:hypothetical protein